MAGDKAGTRPTKLSTGVCDDETHIRLTSEGVRLYPIVQRYTWPSELDLMARIAGLRLKERWNGWEREPFTATGNVVSVYGR